MFYILYLTHVSNTNLPKYQVLDSHLLQRNRFDLLKENVVVANIYVN